MKEHEKYIGLKKGTLALHSHSEFWKILYEQEAQRITQQLKEEITNIEHVGSTAIPNIKAKPIIDILIGVSSFDRLALIVKGMEDLSYIYRGENGIPNRHYFVKGAPRKFHVHLTLSGNTIFENHLKFKNSLLTNPHLAKAYEAIKLNLAKAVKGDRGKYTEGKNDFIQSILIKE